MNEGRGAVDTPHSRDDVFDTVQGLHFRLPEAAEAVPLAVGRHEYIVIVQVGDKVGSGYIRWAYNGYRHGGSGFRLRFLLLAGFQNPSAIPRYSPCRLFDKYQAESRCFYLGFLCDFGNSFWVEK